MAFAVALISWGTATGDDDVRDLGLFLQANLTAAIEQYWFDVDGEVFPRDFPRGALGIVWGSGGKYDTWWDPNPIYVHGINYLPFTGGSLYLARRPNYVAANVAELVKANRGEALQWRDIVWMYLALVDPDRAASLYEENRWFDPEFGSSHAWLSHWIQALRIAGTLDPSVRSDWPASLVLVKGEMRTHCAWNPGDQAREVRFSDGVTLKVPPRSIAHDRR
jgi:endoglucanase Acf2